MNWPTLQDYNEAIQNPQICFLDPELRSGTPTLTKLGLPKTISGAFASVYEMNCVGRRWAVRCFLNQYSDQEERYSAIAKHLKHAQLPCTVSFEFMRDGIRVSGKWYPILKMEWIDGEPLNSYIARNLSQPKILQNLPRQWKQLLDSLRRAGIAHGDLQHGNILMLNNSFRLIDYDGMYVPALAGPARINRQSR